MTMSSRRLALLGAACVAVCLALFAWLHVTPPSSLLDWRTRTISQYALLGNGWAFDAATLLLAAGVVALLCFAPILAAVVAEPFTGVRWWRAIPLGSVERLLGLAEVVTVLLLARWAAVARCGAGNGKAADASVLL